MGLLSSVRDIHPGRASVHRLNRVIPSLHPSGNRLDTITYSFRLACLPLPFGSDEVQGVRFAQARRIGDEQYG